MSEKRLYTEAEVREIAIQARREVFQDCIGFDIYETAPPQPIIVDEWIVQHDGDDLKIVGKRQRELPMEIPVDGLKIKAAAKALNYTPKYVRRLLRNGKLKGSKIRGEWVVSMEELQNRMDYH